MLRTTITDFHWKYCTEEKELSTMQMDVTRNDRFPVMRRVPKIVVANKSDLKNSMYKFIFFLQIHTL